jgi:four helix bundle protein
MTPRDTSSPPFPHEQLDVYRVLVQATETASRWTGFSLSRGSIGDQLLRALSTALLRYTEGYYAQGANQAAQWNAARASCGEAASAVLVLLIHRRIGREQAQDVRELLARAMRMLAKLVRRGRNTEVAAPEAADETEA